MTRLTLLAAASLLAACATTAPTGDGLTEADIRKALTSEAALAALAPPTAPSDLSVLDGEASDVRLALHGDPSGHDTYALTQPPAFAGLGGPEATVALTRDLSRMGWEETTDGFRHRPSGMECPGQIALGEEGPRVALQGIRTYDDRGMDTSCNYVGENVAAVYTLFASRWPDVSKEEHFRQAASLMPREVPVGAQADVPIITVDGLPPNTTIEGSTLGIAYTSPPTDGQVLMTTLLLQKAGDWHIKLRATHTPPAPFLQLFGAIMHVKTVLDVDEVQMNGGPLVEAEGPRTQVAAR